MAYSYILNTGTIVPDTSTTLEEVQAEYLSALGQDLNLDPNTPQGQLITTEVTARNGVIRNNALMANQLNPNNSQGTFLRAVGALMGISDTPVSRSIAANCTLTGTPNLFIPAGSRAKNQTGAYFVSINDVTLSGAGTGTMTFQAVDPGAIAAPANTLVPAEAITGWSGMDNPTDATLGSVELNDYQFRLFRQNALSNQSQNCVEAIKSKVSMLPGITSCVVRDNPNDVQSTIDGIVLPPNAIWVCVNDDGGVSSDIALTLLKTKSPGAPWSASLNSAGTPFTVQVPDPTTGQLYTVIFVRSLPLTVYTQVTVKNNTTMADLSSAVEDAILAYAQGQLPNEPGLVIGAHVSPFEIAGAIATQLPGTYVQLAQVSLDGVTWQTTEIATALWQRAVLPRGNILVNVVN